MVYIFDLDDTLYDELSYVRGGFSIVAEYLEQKENIPSSEAISIMETFLPNDRGSIFDTVLKQYGCYSPNLVQDCIHIYRNHTPTILLYDDVVSFLETIHFEKKYIVTDGNPTVQRKKIQSLGLKKYNVFYYLTHTLGIEFEKPNTVAFELICKRENIKPTEAVYFGDNLKKDFVGITPLGFKTVQILRGNYKSFEYSAQHSAMKTIQSFQEVTPEFLESL